MTSGNYVILAKTGITNVVTSSITGDIAASPITGSSAITGFTLIRDVGGAFSTATQLVGKAFVADYAAPTPDTLITAVLAMEAAYDDIAGRDNYDASRINYGAGSLGGAFGGAGAPLTPGVYTFVTDLTIALDITFSGGPEDIFIIQVNGNLVLAANKNVSLVGGALAVNIYWQVMGNVKVMAGAHMKGILLAKTNIVFVTGSSLSGRALAQTACTLQKATITERAV
jgi:hypothetical protein